MTTTTRSKPARPLLPPPPPSPRQLSIAFETPALQGLATDQRSAAIEALAVVLLQAAGVQWSEDDDVER